MESAKESMADALKVALEDGEVVLEFGRGTEPGPVNATRTVAVTDRIVMPLDAARRLLLSLDDSLKRHEAALRAAAAKALSPQEAALATRPGQVPARAPANAAGERAGLLLQLVGELGVPYQYERSFRISAVGLLANRFLLTVDKRDLVGDARARVLDICDRLDMPRALRDVAEERFGMAGCVHFGFEGDGGSAICKLYLERAVPPEEAHRARERRESVLLHLAFKWEIGTAKQVTTEYLWHPALSAAEIEDRLARYVYRDGQEASLAIAKAMLALGAGKVPAEQLQYLEVQEQGNGRRSFDLNLYNAQLQMKDVQPLLHRMRELYAVRPGQFQALYDQIKAKALGHLAGGVHRDGADFFNLYYGVTGFPRFNERFG